MEDEKVGLPSVSSGNLKWFSCLFVLSFVSTVVLDFCTGQVITLSRVSDVGFAYIIIVYVVIEIKEWLMIIFTRTLEEARERLRKVTKKIEAKGEAKIRAEIVPILTRQVSAEEKLKEIEQVVNGG